MSAKSTGIAALALIFSGVAYGDVVWGIVATVSISSGNGPSTFPDQIVNFNNGGNPVRVTDYTSPVLSASGSYTFGPDTVSGSAMSWDTVAGGVNGVALHGFAMQRCRGFVLPVPSRRKTAASLIRCGTTS